MAGYLSDLDQKFVTETVKRFEHSKTFYQPFHSGLRKIYDLYRCIYTGRPLPTKNKIMLPLMLAAVWSDIAFKLQTCLGDYPYVEFRSDDPAELLRCKRLDAVINRQLTDLRLFEKMVDFLGSGEIYGTAICRLGWRVEKHLHRMRRNLMGTSIEVAMPMTIFDGPDIEIVDLLDWFPAAGYKDIQTMPYCTHRTFMDIDDILESEMDDPLFRKDGLAELLKGGMPSAAEAEANERQSSWRSMSNYEARRTQPMSRQVEILDHWGIWPIEMCPDGVRQRVVTIANRNCLLRNEPSPFWSSKLVKPFFKYCPMPDVHDHFGIGKGEITAKMSAVANQLVSARIDVIQMFLNPAFIAAENAGIDSQSLVLWPGRVVRTKGDDVSDSKFRPLSPDLRGYQLVFDEIGAVSRYIQQATGVSEDAIQGLPARSHTTAREFMGRMEMGKNRLSLEVILLENNVIVPLAEGIQDLNRQYLPMPRIVRRLGPSAVLDDDTGQPIASDPEIMTLDDLNVDAKAYAVGSSRLLGKQAQFQNLTAGGQFAMQNPYVAMQTNWNGFMSRYWKALDVNPQEVMLGKINATNALAAMLAGGGAQGGVGNPMGSPGGGTSLEQLNPAVLGMQQPSNIPPQQ